MGVGDPVDSLAEVKRFGLDPRYTSACCEREGTKRAGCDMHPFCDIPSLPGKGGKDDRPCLLGIEIGKPLNDGGSFLKTEIVRCHTFIRIRAELEENGGSANILAREGEPIPMSETHEVIDPATGLSKIERLKDDKIVPAFERLADQPRFKNAILLEKRREEIAARKRAEKRRTVGMSDETKPEPSPTGVPRK